MKEYFPKSTHFGLNINVELDLFDYATQADLKNARSADSSKFAKKVNLSWLKREIDKLDTGKLETNWIYENVSGVVDKEVVI